MPRTLPEDALTRAFASTRAVVSTLEPEHLGLPTPCDGWDLRTLVNHTIGGSYWYAQTMRDRASPPIEGDDDDYAADNLLAAYDEGIRQALTAFGAPGALDAEVQFVGNSVPARTVMGLSCIDTFTHGWDLAVAAGRSRDLDPELAETLLDVARRILPEHFRGTDKAALFRPRVGTPASMLRADRLAAFLGRTIPPGG